jgi:hypothetical protein
MFAKKYRLKRGGLYKSGKQADQQLVFVVT